MNNVLGLPFSMNCGLKCNNFSCKIPSFFLAFFNSNFFKKILFSAGNVIATGVQVHYKDTCEVSQDIQMYAVENSMKRQAMLWIAALQKVIAR